VTPIDYSVFKANFESVPAEENGDSQFTKNNMNCIWSVDEMLCRSLTGQACINANYFGKDPTMVNKLPCSPEKMIYLQG
jgi:hypothetical protein